MGSEGGVWDVGKTNGDGLDAALACAEVVHDRDGDGSVLRERERR